MSPELKIPKIPISKSKKIFEIYILIRKILQIRRDLVESFVRHILKVPDSNSRIQNFSALGSDKSEISPIWEDGYRLLHLNDDIVFIRCLGSI